MSNLNPAFSYAMKEGGNGNFEGDIGRAYPDKTVSLTTTGGVAKLKSLSHMTSGALFHERGSQTIGPGISFAAIRILMYGAETSMAILGL